MIDTSRFCSGFKTHRLDVRALSEADVHLYCSLYTDAGTMRFIGPPLTVERAARSFRKALDLVRTRPLDSMVFALVERATGETLGLSTLYHYESSQQHIAVGLIMSPLHRSRGIATEGLAGTISHAFRALPVASVWTEISADNLIVGRLVRSVGLMPNDQAAAPSGSDWRVWFTDRDQWMTGNQEREKRSQN
jgi:RimJ/RimL family protein N-acetyltransferase